MARCENVITCRSDKCLLFIIIVCLIHTCLHSVLLLIYVYKVPISCILFILYTNQYDAYDVRKVRTPCGPGPVVARPIRSHVPCLSVSHILLNCTVHAVRLMVVQLRLLHEVVSNKIQILFNWKERLFFYFYSLVYSLNAITSNFSKRFIQRVL
jgi:hypothetical protein